MSSHHALVVLFDVTVLLAVLLFVFILAPAIFSKRVQRSMGWYNLMTAWSVYSLSYGLLIGRQETPAPPPFGICLAQTLAIYAVPPLAAAGMVCYYIEFYLIISGLKSGNPRQPSTLRTFCLIVTPWLVFLSSIIEVLLLVFPGKRAHLVERAGNNFYCHLNDDIASEVSAAAVIGAMLILIPLEVWTGIMIFCHWDVFKRLSRTDRRVYLTVYLRLILCSLAAVIAFAVSMLSFVSPLPLAYPALPISIGIAFAQKDLLQAWLFWRPSEPYASMVFNSGTMFTSTNFRTSQGATTEMSTPEVQMHRSAPTADSLGSATILPNTPPPTSVVVKTAFRASSRPSPPAIIHPKPPQIQSDSGVLERLTEEVPRLTSESNKPRP